MNLCNYSKIEEYNEIEEYSKELAVASYKFRLTPGERPWEDLMISPLGDIWDLKSWVEMFARLEDDIWQVERNTGTTPQEEG